jgi:hypothetical protein
MYSGRPVLGSPFYVEIYDPSKVFVESVQTSWTAGDMVEFDGGLELYLQFGKLSSIFIRI